MQRPIIHRSRFMSLVGRQQDDFVFSLPTGFSANETWKSPDNVLLKFTSENDFKNIIVRHGICDMMNN